MCLVFSAVWTVLDHPFRKVFLLIYVIYQNFPSIQRELLLLAFFPLCLVTFFLLCVVLRNLKHIALLHLPSAHACLFSRCFGLLLSPGRNVKNSDMHLLDLVGECSFLFIFFFCLFPCLRIECVVCLCVFANVFQLVCPTGVNGKELRWEVLHHHRKLEPQHASVSGCE